MILGGRFKGGDFGALRAPLAEREATVVAIGESRPRSREALAPSLPVSEAASMDGAVRLAFTLAPPGGTVLLAPACASFDMFADYAERGPALQGGGGAAGASWRARVSSEQSSVRPRR